MLTYPRRIWEFQRKGHFECVVFYILIPHPCVSVQQVIGNMIMESKRDIRSKDRYVKYFSVGVLIEVIDMSKK